MNPPHTANAAPPRVNFQPRIESDPPMQRFTLRQGWLTHVLEVDGRQMRSQLELPADLAADVDGEDAALLDRWWKAILRGSLPIPERGQPDAGGQPLRIVDLFSGVGGFVLGVKLLAAEAGKRLVCELAVDTDEAALAVHARNHGTRRRSAESVASLVDYRIRGDGDSAEFVYEPELIGERLQHACADVDLLIAGPPCQGHSNLNNHSRRNDRRNYLYLAVPAFAVACRARAVIIENVTSVVHDDAEVVRTARRLFETNGYATDEGVIAADAMGWPQTRKRHFLVARRIGDAAEAAFPLPISDVATMLAAPSARTVTWAIGSTESLSTDPALHVTAEYTAENLERIEWLFDNDEYDLALQHRPKSHQAGTTYGAVYGRMHADRPAPTITTGFNTPGRGRFIHPNEPRTMTPAEAARLQGFPDTFRFTTDPSAPPGKAALAKWIGDAVTMPLGYAAALSAIGPGLKPCKDGSSASN